MTVMASIEVPQTVLDALAEARAERDDGMEAADSTMVAAVHRRHIDAVITAYAETGVVFSANEVRALLPEVPGRLMGPRFSAASLGKRIRFAGYVTSTKKNTHAKPVARWRGVTTGASA